ncbi:phage tail protein [Stenotrophomonas lactitubi]|uniref:phage tail protein n=1 Tax=Stenotrophomonas lactitubi TaxID=2045214 RepID=UPI00224940DE|nr:phage tail protein [Stenotrophomonas lactitubi]MCX2892124.1 phage tail protein [Stenotrophomonas lactitubi]
MSLYTLTVDLLAKTASFEKDMGKAERIAAQRSAQIQQTLSTLATTVGTALGTAAVAAGTAVATWTKEVSELALQYERFSQISGSTSQSFQRMAAGANVVGISHEKLADILKDVQDKIGDYVQTGGGAMADFFENIAKRTGVTAEQMRKLSGPDALGLYFSSLEKANLSQAEMTFYMEAIASDSAALIPLLRNSGNGFKQWGDAAQAAGAIISNDTAKAMGDLRRVTQEAELAFLGVKVQVAQGVIPTLTELNKLLHDPQSQDAMRSATNGITAFGKAAVDAAAGFGQLVVSYTGWLKSKGFMPVSDGDSLDNLQARRGSLQNSLKNWKGIFSDDAKDKVKSELAEVDSLIAAFPFRGVSATVDSTASAPGKPLPYRPTGNIGKADRAKSDSEAKRRAEEIARYKQQAQEAAGAMDGPLAEAMAKHLGNMAEYNDLLAKGNIAQADANVLMGQSAMEYAKVAAEVEKATAGPEKLLATFDTELVMLGKAGRARELYRRQLVNEKDMRDELQKAVEAAGSRQALADAKGKASYEEYEQSMLAAAAAAAELSLQVEEGAANVEALANIIVSGMADGVDAFADFVADGMRNFDDLWDGLKNAAKRGLRDMIAEIAKQKLIIPIQTQIMNGSSGQDGGFSLDSLMGLFGGNGSAAGGKNVSNVAGLLSKGQGLFGFGRSAGAASGTLTGFGDVTSMAGMTGSSFSGLIGGGSAGAGAGAASTAAAAVPIIGWIVAGMMKNAELFDQGWDIANGESWAGKIATAGAVGLADKGFRGLGFNDKTASILSGSSIHAKLFGRSAPKVTGQGITGDYGFGGFNGQSYADIKAKGGLFRSDKKWTQYGALDPGIDRTFDMAARQVRGAATDLAKQLGVDLSGQLAGVKVSLGKLQLSADSAEAKSQLEAYLADMTDRLFTEAVRAAGFGGQLDGYFEASDVFSALSASIALAVGNADELGRALSGMEVEKVNKAVDYFQDLASVAGTDLATQVQKVTGLLGNYATLMADVSTQLMTGDLSSYQQQALTIERTYRQQVKSANDYAKALGLSGARAEDLAKIEALRAMNMGKLQAQIDKDKKAMQYGLSISDLSPLTDQEKLGEAMKELQRAVAGGDTSAAQSAAQAALGFGRNLYASGKDYNGLYDQVTGLIDGMKVGDLDKEDGTSMGQLADAIEALPDNFSRAVFDLVVNKDAQSQTTAAVQQGNSLLLEQNQLLRDLLATTTQGVRTSSSSALRNSLNAVYAR